ncbi:MAG: hypothetical protein MZV63_26110 [Marinilabiliales bacterium]|nr:hypothetical protein [Marinilabiliales bacterium]
MVAAVGVILSALDPGFLESLFGGGGVVPFLAGLAVGAVALIPGFIAFSGGAPPVERDFHRGFGRFCHEPPHGGRGHASPGIPVFRPESGVMAERFIADCGRDCRSGDVPGVEMTNNKSERGCPWICRAAGGAVLLLWGGVPPLAEFFRLERVATQSSWGMLPRNGPHSPRHVHPGRPFRSLGAAEVHRALFGTRSRVEGRPWLILLATVQAGPLVRRLPGRDRPGPQRVFTPERVYLPGRVFLPENPPPDL